MLAIKGACQAVQRAVEFILRRALHYDLPIFLLNVDLRSEGLLQRALGAFDPHMGAIQRYSYASWVPE